MLNKAIHVIVWVTRTYNYTEPRIAKAWIGVTFLYLFDLFLTPKTISWTLYVFLKHLLFTQSHILSVGVFGFTCKTHTLTLACACFLWMVCVLWSSQQPDSREETPHCHSSLQVIIINIQGDWNKNPLPFTILWLRTT